MQNYLYLSKKRTSKLFVSRRIKLYCVSCEIYTRSYARSVRCFELFDRSPPIILSRDIYTRILVIRARFSRRNQKNTLERVSRSKIWERWEKREEKRGEKARHRLKIPFAFSLPFPLSPGSALSARVQHLPSRKKKKEEETNSLLSGEGGKEKGVFLREGKVSLTPSRRETRHSAAKRGKRGCHQETERERERENPRPFTGSGGGGGGGVVSWPPWRAALSTYSHPRLASSPPPPCLPRHPYLPTFLPLLLHLVCAAATTEVARGSRWKPVTKESFDRRSSPSRGIYRGNVGKGYLTSHVFGVIIRINVSR